MARPIEPKYADADVIGRRLMAQFGKVANSRSFREAFQWIAEATRTRPLDGSEAKKLLDRVADRYRSGDVDFFRALALVAEKTQPLPPGRGHLLPQQPPPEDPVRSALMEAFFGWGTTQKWSPTFAELQREVERAGWPPLVEIGLSLTEFSTALSAMHLRSRCS